MEKVFHWTNFLAFGKKAFSFSAFHKSTSFTKKTLLYIATKTVIMTARSADVFCSSLRICLILVAFAVKSRCFCQPDGISLTLFEEDVYCTENFICSLLFATKVHEKYIYHQKEFLYVYCCLCLKMSRNLQGLQN